MGLFEGDAVPEFGFALMQEVYRRQVQVLLVPAEEGLPRTHVAIGSSHSSHIAIDSVAEYRVQTT